MLRQAHRKFLSGVSLFSTFALVAFEAQAGWCSADQHGNQKSCYYDRGACEVHAHPMGWRCFPDGGQSNQNNQNNDAYNAGRALGMLLFGDPNKKRQEAIEQERLELERQRLELERERLALQRERQNTSSSGYVGQTKNGLAHGWGTFTDADGSKIAGEFKDGQPNGWINLYSATGALVRQGWYCINVGWSQATCPN